MKRLLAVVAGGLGNMIQMTAAIRTLRERLGRPVDMYVAGCVWGDELVRPLFEGPARVYRAREAGSIDRREYEGKVVLGFGAGVREAGRLAEIPTLNDARRQAVGFESSEVEVSMGACRELGIPDSDLIWQGEVNWNREFPERFDVVAANGYYRPKGSQVWAVKGYPHFEGLVGEIRRRWPALTICSIGFDRRERIEGTADRTGLAILDSVALVKRARFIVCTDSMAFHAAGALGTRAFALFTATSVRKNFDGRFHRGAVVIGRDELECRRDCQAAGMRWRKCESRECQDIPVGHIANEIALYERGWSGQVR